MDRADWASLAWLSAGISAISALVATALGLFAGPEPALAGAALGCLAALGFAVAAVRQRRGRDAKAARELLILSERLLRLEAARSTAADGGPSRWPQALAADVELLGRLVGDLAATVATQEGELRAIRGELGRRPDAVPAPAPPEIDLTSRETFARTAQAILQRLSPDGADPRPGPAATAERADGPSDAAAAALDQDRLELFLRPVVTLPQRRIRYFEAEARLRTGDDGAAALAEADVLTLLQARGLRPSLDRQLLERVVALARHLSDRGGNPSVACPIGRESLGDPGFLDEAGRLLGSGPASARRIMLSLPHHAFAGLDRAEQAALSGLAALGPGVAVTSVADTALDWTALARAGVSCATVDSGLLLSLPRGTVSDMVSEAGRAGIRLVAAGVGRAEDIPDLIDLDMELAEGPALGAARPTPAGLAAPALREDPARAGDVPPPGEPATPPAPEARMSLRDVIRRAG